MQEAAAAIKEHTLEPISITYAPPDMWARTKDSGKTMADLFTASGVPIVRSDNNRVQGHMMIKNMLAPLPVHDSYVKKLFPNRQTLPGLMFFSAIGKALDDLRDIQADDKNPNDCAKQPHEVTHTVDGIRYFCVSRVVQAEPEHAVIIIDEEDEHSESYEEYMCGGNVSSSYM